MYYFQLKSHDGSTMFSHEKNISEKRFAEIIDKILCKHKYPGNKILAEELAPFGFTRVIPNVCIFRDF